MLAATDSFVGGAGADFPIKVRTAIDLRPAVHSRGEHPAVRPGGTPRGHWAGMPLPTVGRRLGKRWNAAREDLYRAGTFRKYILVVTDGENTDGTLAAPVAREINRRSEGAVRMYFVAFDIDADRFAFLRDVRGEVVGARNGDALRARLDEIYRGKILVRGARRRRDPPSGGRLDLAQFGSASHDSERP